MSGESAVTCKGGKALSVASLRTGLNTLVKKRRSIQCALNARSVASSVVLIKCTMGMFLVESAIIRRYRMSRAYGTNKSF